MKKKLFNLLFIFSLLFIIFGCTTLPNVLSFPQSNRGFMLYITPTEVKDKNVDYFTIDSTFYLSDDNLSRDVSIKYTIAIENMSRKDISNLRYILRYGEEVIELSKNEVYVDIYKDNIIEIRFESFLSPEKATELISSNEKIYMDILSNDIHFTCLNLAKYKEKLNGLRIYF